MNFFFLSENDFKIRESNEDIMCAKELLTLGQNAYSKVSPLNCSLYVEEEIKDLGQIVVHVSPSVKSKNQFEIHSKSPSGTFLNVDGNFSESSDSAGESDCENVSLPRDTSACVRVLLNKHSGSKSTVEGSCPSALAKSPINSVKKKLKTKKKNKRISSVRVNKNSEVKTNPDNGELMVGDFPPSSPKCPLASGCFSAPEKSPEVKNSAAEAVEAAGCSDPVKIGSQQEEEFPLTDLHDNFISCDSESGLNMNNIVSTAEAVVTVANTVTAGLLSFQQGRAATLTNVPATVCVSSINGAAGHIVAVAGMNLGHSPPVLVFSANSGFGTAGSPAGNLILSNFAGAALPMALFPGTAANKIMSATQVSLQGGDILKLTGGGLNTVQSLPGGMLALPSGSFQLGTVAAGPSPRTVATVSGSGCAPVVTVTSVVTSAAPVISESIPGPSAISSLVTSAVVSEPPVTATAASSDSSAEAAAYDKGLKEMRVEPTYKEDGTVEWNCNVCFKVNFFFDCKIGIVVTSTVPFP